MISTRCDLFVSLIVNNNYLFLATVNKTNRFTLRWTLPQAVKSFYYMSFPIKINDAVFEKTNVIDRTTPL